MSIDYSIPQIVNRCPRCQGRLSLDKDSYGLFINCAWCGYIEDLPPAEPDKQTGDRRAFNGQHPNSLNCLLLSSKRSGGEKCQKH